MDRGKIGVRISVIMFKYGLGILRIPTKQVTYYGTFNNNKMDGIFKVIM
jgi:hypothetical protein